MMTVVKKLYLTFKDENGRTVNVIVPDPKDEVNAAAAKVAGDLIVEKNVMDSHGHSLKSYEGAKIVSTTTEALA